MQAFGVAAYAVVMQMLTVLEQRRALTRDDVVDIIDGALSAIEELPTVDGSVRLARQALERHLRLLGRG